jgi:hypothetical protein
VALKTTDTTAPPEASGPAPAMALYRDADPAAPTVGLIAFALHCQAAVEGRVPQDGPARFRQQADAMFRTDAFRYLHNRVEELRREAASQALAGTRRPPGFIKLVAASLTAILLAAAAALAVTGQMPAAITAVRGSVAGWLQ